MAVSIHCPAGPLVDAVRQRAASQPGQLAVAGAGPGLSYQELASRAEGLRQVLARAALRPGQVLAAATYTLADLAITAIAAASLDVTLYPLDIRQPSEAHAARMGQLQAGGVVLAGFPGGLWTGRRPVFHLDEIGPAGPLAPPGPAGGGITLESEWRDEVVSLDWPGLLAPATELVRLTGLTAADRLIVAALPHTDLVLLGLVSSLLSGGAAILPERPDAGGDGLRRAIEAHRATVLAAAPRSASLLAEIAVADGITLPDLRSILLARDCVPGRLPAALAQVTRNDVQILLAGRAAGNEILGPVGPVPAAAPAGPERTAEILIEAWSAVRMAAVIATGQGGPVAFVETLGGARVDPPELLADLKARLAASGLPASLLPSLVVAVPGLPVTATGVVDRDRLAARARQLAGPGTDGARAALPQPAGPGPARILESVSDTLGIPGLAADLSLFEVGATSVEIVRVVAELEDELGFEVDLDELLRAPYVRTLIGQYLAAHPQPATS
jgi:acyl carrier protein